MVFAHDPETGLSGGRAVTAVWPHEDTLIEFEVGDGTVTTTEDHEFWNVTDQAWQETQHIDQGDLLLTADGQTVEAGNLLWDTAHHAPTYDLTVDGIHTYHVSTGGESVLVHNNSRCDPELVAELEANGVRHTPANIQRIGRNDDGDIIFLETGNESSGLAHILDEHTADFAGVDVETEAIPDLVFEAATRGNPVGLQGSSRTIFEVDFRGQTQLVAIDIGDNGYIVGANPRTSIE